MHFRPMKRLHLFTTAEQQSDWTRAWPILAHVERGPDADWKKYPDIRGIKAVAAAYRGGCVSGCPLV